MSVVIRLLEPGDTLISSLAAVMQEMQDHYQVPSPAYPEIVAGIEGRPPGAEILIAAENDALVGFAAFSGIYPGPYLRPGLFLKELYVGNRHRGKGFGRLLMQALASIARDRGLSRIDWTADPENLRLLSFYDDIGGARKPDKLFYRLDGSALDDLAGLAVDSEKRQRA
ncbi:N-acetyltransferase family protein [Neorhizobium petrolearium]|uniref:GNAT family N-acetyltransferase n=1 Tax=Neorhizobium petrolearium TaxID=515361 RepID=UPI003F81F6B7